MAKKKPKNRAAKKVGKMSAKDSGSSVMDKHPLFSLQYLKGNYCLSCCTKEHKAAFADTLHKLAAIPWKELYKAGRHGAGFEKIDSHSIRVGIPPVARDKKLLAFRYHATNPMVGFQEKEVFHVLWLDKDFSLYDHGS